MSKSTRCFSALFLVTSMSSAQAATTYYHSETDFLSALGGTGVTQNFESSAAGTVIADGDVLDSATYSYTLAGPGSPSIIIDDFYGTTSANNYLATDDGSGAFVGGDSFTITFDQTMYAIGLYVISADLILDDDFTITTSSGQTVNNIWTSDALLSDGEAYYLGLIEDDFSQGFDSITLSSADFDFLYNVDDITVSAVPVPAAIWLFGSGLFCLAGVSRKRLLKS